MKKTIKQIYEIRKAYLSKYHKYKMTYFKNWNYSVLENVIFYRKKGRGKNTAVNEIWIMADTETSKKKNKTNHNHVVAWTISLRAFGINLVTLWGRKPSDMINTMFKIHSKMKGEETVFYFHNYAYDYVFLRKFMFKAWGVPAKQLNVKSHYPINMLFNNGIVIKDSLILAQRSLEKWAKDMNVTQKAVGKWDYNKIRSQNEHFTAEELEYIECDTLAGVECLDALATQLHKNVNSMPFTATGIPREEVRNRGKQHRARDRFMRMVPTYDQYIKLTKVFHGGYTHANRFISGQVITEGGESFDFTSSYPFVMLSEKYPMSKFSAISDKTIDYILEYSDQYAFMFKLILTNVRLKKGIPMPVLQASKSDMVNPVLDNGRIIAASYISIFTNEIDLELIASQYEYDYSICTEVEFAIKDYLPRWFTDYVFELFNLKTTLKGGDPVAYALSKAKLNSLYGMCVMRNVKIEILEDYDTGEYSPADDKLPEDIYNKYINNKNNILNYAWGVWVTSYALSNLHKLGACVDYENGGVWLYSDTDSCYATKWNMLKLYQLNNSLKAKLRANNYDSVIFNDREYCLGVAELDSTFSEFITQGAKRYCKREADGLHITVAGVPKKGAQCLNDDILNFSTGFIFPGKVTGKLTHNYYYVDEIYLDQDGNETGDSIDLIPCDYLLGHDGLDPDYEIEDLFVKEEAIQVYEET